MREKITKIFICDGSRNVFNDDVEYEIPIYQRLFAWGEDELARLIEDIEGFDEDEYCIGSLIVNQKSDGIYEVVDGQQRLTSLFLLLNCLNIHVEKTLSFANREESNYVLKQIEIFLKDPLAPEEEEKAQKEILSGLRIINRLLPRDKKKFAEQLKRVYLYRIIVPPHTDLNHYFEIMNTRGEQLEQPDILKARLMDALLDSSDREIFATIWDACSDMSGYVQMHFSTQNRKIIFGKKWQNKPSLSWDAYKKVRSISTTNSASCIRSIVKKDFVVEVYDGYNEDDKKIKFESIVDFPHFLIHVLKVFVKTYCLNENSLIEEMIDDKKLLYYFKKVKEFGVLSSGAINKNSEQRCFFSQQFVLFLLKMRFVFDSYIIKRLYENEDPVGKWSLMELHCSKNKPNYVDNLFALYREWGKTYESRHKQNLMIQAAFRVSYTSPKSMHWITVLLSWLSKKGFENKIDEYFSIANSFAKDAVKKDFFDRCKNQYNLGVDTPHIVFNYLDFLLWNSNQKNFNDFNFEFRNSVEHWYPQHPSDESLPKWSHEKGLDNFGNLCIVSGKINSKFSNLAPFSKMDTYKKDVNEGSLKLRLMGKETAKCGNAGWREGVFKKHENEMIKLLKDACEIE